MKNNLKFSSLALILTILLSSFTMPLFAVSSNNSTVVNVINPNKVELGDTFNISINITQVEDFDASNFDILFDSEIINVTDAFGGNINSTNIPLSGWNLIEPGKVRVLVNLPGITGVSGDGYLAKVQFEAISNGTSNLNFSNQIISSVLAEEIIADWFNSQIQVGDDEPKPSNVSIELPFIHLFNVYINFVNTGETDITNLEWNLKMNSILMTRYKFTDSGTLDKINASDEKTIQTDQISRGFAFVELKINVTTNELNFEKEFYGIIIGPFLIILNYF